MQRTFQIALLGLISIAFPATSAGVEFASPVSYPVGTSPAGVVVADFNGDGKLDIAVANSGSANVSILLGNGDGTFQAAVNFDAGMSNSASWPSAIARTELAMPASKFTAAWNVPSPFPSRMLTLALPN